MHARKNRQQGFDATRFFIALYNSKPPSPNLHGHPKYTNIHGAAVSYIPRERLGKRRGRGGGSSRTKTRKEKLEKKNTACFKIKSDGDWSMATYGTTVILMKGRKKAKNQLKPQDAAQTSRRAALSTYSIYETHRDATNSNHRSRGDPLVRRRKIMYTKQEKIRNADMQQKKADQKQKRAMCVHLFLSEHRASRWIFS